MDGDGKLNLEELKLWLIPTGYDPNNAEAVHLMHHADSDMVSRVGNTVSHFQTLTIRLPIFKFTH